MQIKNLHVEASSYCNARCPGCPRNAYGFPLSGFFKEENLSPITLKQILSKYKEVETINFCGNHGDPMMNPEIAELVKESGCDCSIATNGSIGKLETYKKLAHLNTKIVFGIDGLEDTNHLYRQDVKWNNLMIRLKHFISCGGKAHWQYIVFKHNAHQIETARKLSEQLGFKSFFTIDIGRNNFPAIDKNKNISHWVLSNDKHSVPDKNFNVDDYLRMRYKPYNLPVPTTKIAEIDCEHKRGSVYVDSSGELFPCCYHGFGHIDRPKVPLERFTELENTWGTDRCNSVCNETCSKII